MRQRGFTMFDLLGFVGLCAGICVGAKYGGVIGAAIGALAGLLLGRLPYSAASWAARRKLEQASSQALRERLRSGKEYFIAHLLLAHLMKRGEDVSGELPVIVGLIKSASSEQRRFGWAALKFAFPDNASKLAGFDPRDSVEKCREAASRIEL